MAGVLSGYLALDTPTTSINTINAMYPYDPKGLQDTGFSGIT